LDEFDIIPKFKGTLVHDCWGAYFSYSSIHAICNSHILRELERSQNKTKPEMAVENENFAEKNLDKTQ